MEFKIAISGSKFGKSTIYIIKVTFSGHYKLLNNVDINLFLTYNKSYVFVWLS